MIKNLTPHAINIVDQDGNIIKTIKSVDGYSPIRIPKDTVDTNITILGIPLVRKVVKIDEVQLPAPEDGVTFLVSGLVLDFVKKHTTRTDFVAPDTDRAVRNDKGHIVGVPALEF